MDADRLPFGAIRSSVRSREHAIELACELEARAPKLGNVHPHARFDDCDFDSFCAAGRRIAPVLAAPMSVLGFGEKVLRAIQETRCVTKANVNLGIVLLLAPLSAVDDPLEIEPLLQSLTPEDGRLVFEAIRLASAGGMDEPNVAPEHDVHVTSAEVDLIAAMTTAASRDQIAQQYAGGFKDFFSRVLPTVRNNLGQDTPCSEAIVRAQLSLLAQERDTLIARKCGVKVADDAQARAAACLENDTLSNRQRFDAWLRADGNRRNPGTTADFIAAALYWSLMH